MKRWRQFLALSLALLLLLPALVNLTPAQADEVEKRNWTASFIRFTRVGNGARLLISGDIRVPKRILLSRKKLKAIP